MLPVGRSLSAVLLATFAFGFTAYADAPKQPMDGLTREDGRPAPADDPLLLTDGSALEEDAPVSQPARVGQEQSAMDNELVVQATEVGVPSSRADECDPTAPAEEGKAPGSGSCCGCGVWANVHLCYPTPLYNQDFNSSSCVCNWPPAAIGGSAQRLKGYMYSQRVSLYNDTSGIKIHIFSLTPCCPHPLTMAVHTYPVLSRQIICCASTGKPWYRVYFDTHPCDPTVTGSGGRQAGYMDFRPVTSTGGDICNCCLVVEPYIHVCKPTACYTGTP